MKVVVIAFGTRGDVQPLVILAAGIASSCAWCSKMVFVTHKQHASVVESLLNVGEEYCCDGLVEIATVDSPPVLWKGTPGFDLVEERATDKQERGCMETCRGAGLVIFNMFALEGFHISEAYRIPCAVCHPYLTARPMPSSFSARMRRTYPQLFRRLTRLPDNKRASPGQSRDLMTTGSCHRSGEVQVAATETRTETAWAHVEHWMWPLFTDKWGSFRERLGLRPCPFQEGQAVRSPATGGESLSVARNGDVDALRPVDPRQLPLVLYLFSELVVDLSPYWPLSVHVCGYLFPSTSSTVKAKGNQEGSCSLDNRQKLAPLAAEKSLQFGQEPAGDLDEATRKNAIKAAISPLLSPEKCCGLPPDVEAFLSASEDRPIYVGFGSMWSMCSPGYRLSFAFRALLLAARQTGCRCIVTLPMRGSSDAPPDTAGGTWSLRELGLATDWVLAEVAASTGQGDLLVHQGPLAHDLLLPRCSVGVHHGGSGTTAAILRAGIPHVVCPQHLDQFFWAERVHYLAVGNVLEKSLFAERDSAPLTPLGSLVRQAAAAIQSSLTPQMKLRAACLGVKIRAENGLENALGSLTEFVGNQRSTASVPCRQRNSTFGETVMARPSADPPMSKDVVGKEVGESEARLTVGLPTLRPLGQVGGNGRRIDKDVSEAELVLREMPNGLKVWGGKYAEEETFFIYAEIFEDRTYARMGIRVQDGDTVWDVGANIGLASIFFELESDTPDSLDLYVFEPVSFNRKALKRNMSAHCPRAFVVEHALGAKHEDDVPVTFYPRMPGNSTLNPSEKELLQGRVGCTEKEHRNGSNGAFLDNAQQEACNVRTVSWAMASLDVEAIDLLKIDVEGSELDVLLGIDEEDWPKIRQVVVEVHPVGDRVTRASSILRHQGFDVLAQALGLDGAPISPSHGVGVSVSATEGGELFFNSSRKAFPRREQPRANSALNILEQTVGAVKVGNGEKVAGASTSEAGAGRDAADGTHWWQNNIAQDGVVFMVYAKRH